jgi:hypothetical protein
MQLFHRRTKEEKHKQIFCAIATGQNVAPRAAAPQLSLRRFDAAHMLQCNYCVHLLHGALH